MENLNNTDESPNSPTSPNLQSSESVYESSSDLNFLLLLEKGSELALNTLSLILFPIVSLTHPLKSLLLISLVWVPQILFRKFCKIKNGAVQEEMRALHKNGTWDLVELPIRKVLGCKWVFTVKFKSDVKIDWYKAKLGCKRIHTNLRDQLHVFLYGDLEEEVFMELPPGFEENFRRRKVWRLRKSLYGLMQSPHAWFEKFYQVSSW